MRFWEYFQATEETSPEPDVEEASIVMEFASSQYWQRMKSWLDTELSRPFPVSDQMAMIQSGVRANTLREVKAKIERDISGASAILKASGRI